MYKEQCRAPKPMVSPLLGNPSTLSTRLLSLSLSLEPPEHSMLFKIIGHVCIRVFRK